MKYLANSTTLEYDHDKCRGCGKCVEVCPHGVFLMHDKRAMISDRDLCMECGACVKNCEFGAITVNYGVGCASAIIRGFITGGEPSCGCADSAGGTAKTECC